MVPFELLFRLHVHLRGSPEPSHPTYLHLPYELTLDALTAPVQSTPVDSTVPVPIQQNGTPLSAIPPSVMQTEMNEDMPTPPPAAHTSPKLSIDASLVPLPESPEIQRRPQLPINVVDPPSYFNQSFSSTLRNDIHEATTSTIDLPPAPQRPVAKQNGRTASLGLNGVKYMQNGATATNPEDEDFRNFLKRKSLPVAAAPAPPAPRLGNLMLSSCPGKKG